jgi:hypothetical protein
MQVAQPESTRAHSFVVGKYQRYGKLKEPTNKEKHKFMVLVSKSTTHALN